MKHQLRFDGCQIRDIASRYRVTASEDELIRLRPVVTERGYLDKDDIRKVVRWKAPRVIRHAESNPEEFAREVTQFALHAREEKTRIESLLILGGVSWPMASVILHFFRPEPYPILDYRALWSLGICKPSSYDYDFWWDYVLICRDLAKKNAVDMRTLDRALWQYSKENQRGT